MKTIVFALTVSVYAFAPDVALALPSNEGLSRQIQSLRSAVQSFADNMNPRVNAIEALLATCPDGKYGVVRHKGCTDPVMSGFVLEQCIQGAWVESVNSCRSPQSDVVFIKDTNFRLTATDRYFSDISQMLYREGIARSLPTNSDYVNDDPLTLSLLCQHMGFAGSKTERTSKRHHDCDDVHIYGYDGALIWAKAGKLFGTNPECRYVTSFTCTASSDGAASVPHENPAPQNPPASTLADR